MPTKTAPAVPQAGDARRVAETPRRPSRTRDAAVVRCRAVEQVLDRDRHAVQRTAVAARRELAVGLARLPPRLVRHHQDERVGRRIARFDPRRHCSTMASDVIAARAKLRAELLDRHAVSASPRWRRRRAAARWPSAAPGARSRRSLYSAIACVSAASCCGVRREARHDLAVPQHVVGDQQAARPQQIDQAIEQRRVELLVAVLKDQVERARRPSRASAARRRRSTLTRSASPARAKFSRASRARSSSSSIVNSMPSGRQRAGEPDARVADRGADLEDARGARSAVASTRSSAPTSASTSGRSRCRRRRARCRRAPRRPARLSRRDSCSTASGTIWPIIDDRIRTMRCAHEDHRDGRSGQRLRRRRSTR